MCPASNLSFSTIDAVLYCLAVQSVPALSDQPVDDLIISALGDEATLETIHDLISTAEEQIVSKEAGIAAEVAQADNLEQHVKMSK